MSTDRLVALIVGAGNNSSRTKAGKSQHVFQMWYMCMWQVYVYTHIVGISQLSWLPPVALISLRHLSLPLCSPRPKPLLWRLVIWPAWLQIWLTKKMGQHQIIITKRITVLWHTTQTHRSLNGMLEPQQTKQPPTGVPSASAPVFQASLKILHHLSEGTHRPDLLSFRYQETAKRSSGQSKFLRNLKKCTFVWTRCGVFLREYVFGHSFFWNDQITNSLEKRTHQLEQVKASAFPKRSAGWKKKRRGVFLTTQPTRFNSLFLLFWCYLFHMFSFTSSAPSSRFSGSRWYEHGSHSYSPGGRHQWHTGPDQKELKASNAKILGNLSATLPALEVFWLISAPAATSKRNKW